MIFKFRITFTFADRAKYSYVVDDGDDDDASLQEGIWNKPFPNEKGNSLAYGMREYLEQSDIGVALCCAHGEIIKIESKLTY